RESSAALQWVKSLNRQSEVFFRASPLFDSIEAEIREVIMSSDKLALPSLVDGMVFNLWKDKTNPKGVWRRTSISSFQSVAIKWEVLIDFDELSKKEGKSLVFKGATRSKAVPGLVLDSMSVGGSDAAIIRAFDL